MYAKTISVLANLMVLRPVVADFKVFCGSDSNGLDGISAPSCLFVNDPPDCSATANRDYLTTDVTKCGGISCDGCDLSINVNDLAPSRIEAAEYHCDNADKFWGPGDDTHFTIYADRKAMVDVDGNQIGDCNPPDDPQILDCQDSPWSHGAWKNVYDCINTDIVVR